jgi:iron-sulfur cluster repair protein YtfE (RIC family)
MYLYLLHGYAPNYQETLKELIQYGKKTEYAYFEDRTSDEYMEEVLTSHMIEEAYIDFVSHQNKSYQQIILGRIPVLGNGVERTAKIAKEINCTRSYVSREANKCKRLLFNDAKIQSLLSEETKRTRKLK